MLQEFQNHSFSPVQTEGKHLPNIGQAKWNAWPQLAQHGREPRLFQKRQIELNNKLYQNVIRINVYIETLLAQEQYQEARQRLEQVTQILHKTQRILKKKAEYLSTDEFNDGELQVNPLFKLTEREREVLALIAYGYTSAKIADRLYITSSTVRTYHQRILQKLNVKDRADLQRIAIKYDLIDSVI